LFFADQLPAECNQGCSMPVSKEVKVPNAHEASGEHMQQKAAQELIGGKGHLSLLIPVRIVLPAEGHVFTIEVQ
jgi:hypothetical protein